MNGTMKKWFSQHGILHSVTHNEKKANYVERLIRTIKKRIVKFFQHRNSLRYIDHLQEFITSYNDTYHTGIKMRPNKVNSNNEQMLWEQQYVEPFIMDKDKKKNKKKMKFRFKLGDRVRISYLITLFEREYHQKWTGEVFTVKKRWSREGIPVYEIDDYGGQDVEGTFYEPELQRVTFDEDQPFKIEKVLKTRGRGHNKEYYVKWMNWPAKYNSWTKDVEYLN